MRRSRFGRFTISADYSPAEHGGFVAGCLVTLRNPQPPRVTSHAATRDLCRTLERRRVSVRWVRYGVALGIPAPPTLACVRGRRDDRSPGPCARLACRLHVPPLGRGHPRRLRRVRRRPHGGLAVPDPALGEDRRLPRLRSASGRRDPRAHPGAHLRKVPRLPLTSSVRAEIARPMDPHPTLHLEEDSNGLFLSRSIVLFLGGPSQRGGPHSEIGTESEASGVRETPECRPCGDFE